MRRHLVKSWKPHLAFRWFTSSASFLNNQKMSTSINKCSWNKELQGHFHSYWWNISIKSIFYFFCTLISEVHQTAKQNNELFQTGEKGKGREENGWDTSSPLYASTCSALVSLSDCFKPILCRCYNISFKVLVLSFMFEIDWDQEILDRDEEIRDILLRKYPTALLGCQWVIYTYCSGYIQKRNRRGLLPPPMQRTMSNGIETFREF